MPSHRLLAGALALAIGVAWPLSGTAAAAPPAAQVTWLVPTTGSPPSVRDENRAAGSLAWRVRAQPAGRGRVAGYVAAQDARPGQVQRIYVRAAGARTVEIRLFRMGWYGGSGGRLVMESGPLRASHQPACTHHETTGLTECAWLPTLTFTLPPSLPSGVYIAKLTTDRGAERACIFVLEARRPAPLLVQIPTATYEAYNYWGGDSLYPGGSRVVATGSTQGVEVSYDRPYDGKTGAGQFFDRDVGMVRFLERAGYPVSYTTSEGVDQRPRSIARARVALDIGHSEYWSDAAAGAFRSARDHGTNLAFFSSDKMAWRVRFAPASPASSEAGEADHRIVAYKEYAARDPDRLRPTGPFGPTPARLAGTAFGGCITPRLPVRGSPAYDYFAWRPQPALFPRWLFRGTGLTPGSQVPGIVGYELDRVMPESPRVLVLGTGRARCMGRGARPIGDTTLYRAASGALVFSSGTMGWLLALAPRISAAEGAFHEDVRLVKLTRNLLDHLAGAKSEASLQKR